MKISLVTVGKLKEKYLKEAVHEYTKRLSRFCKLQIIEVKDEPAPEKLSQAEKDKIKWKEAERILQSIKSDSVIVVLDMNGRSMKSENFAAKLNSWFVSGKSNIIFIIGGSLGLDKKVLNKSDLQLSLSKMTFPHQLTRLVLLEQLFRAFKIINGEPYHK